MRKPLPPSHPIHDLLQNRWSPYGFDGGTLSREELLSLFEAARWAPSAYNAQPWHYLVGVRGDDTFERILGSLIEPNRAWAQHAAALAIGVVRGTFPHNGQPNATAAHDLGLAAGALLVEATARGIAVHQMSGILHTHIRSEFALPEGFEPVTALALGRPGTPPEFPAALAERDAAARPRKPLQEFVFGGTWGTRAGFVPD